MALSLGCHPKQPGDECSLTPTLSWYIENEVKSAFEALCRNGWQATVSVLSFGLTDEHRRPACFPFLKGRWSNSCAGVGAPSAHTPGHRSREAGALPDDGTSVHEVMMMLAPEIHCVVGIDVAKHFHVVCALEAPSGSLRKPATKIAATAEGYAQLCTWLRTWGEKDKLLIGMEATGTLWEPLHDTLTRVGYMVLVLNPRQTSAWAASLGLRAKTDGIDAQTLARGLLAGYARASTLPSETIQALRALTRARRDLIGSRSAARQRIHDELVLLFPELMTHLPTGADLGTPAVLQLLSTYSSAEQLARAEGSALATLLRDHSAGRWGGAEA